MSVEIIATGEIYHIYNKSIADYVIFNNDSEFSQIIETIRYYQIKKPLINFSKFKERNMQYFKNDISDNKNLVEIICYCPMPTHIHLILKQLKEKGISKFMNNVCNSYSHYFNLKHNRKGPLWEGRFKKVLVETDEQLLHLTRYIHLNPVTAYLVNNPADWEYSSYKEYVGASSIEDTICKYDDIMDIKPDSYKVFVENRIGYQRELAKIKDLMFD